MRRGARLHGPSIASDARLATAHMRECFESETTGNRAQARAAGRDAAVAGMERAPVSRAHRHDADDPLTIAQSRPREQRRSNTLVEPARPVFKDST